MASGTNAWTATDHTAYTLSTAGGEGMLNLLPIFADHVLFATLTEEGFVTEVHCVNGSGEDKGVVYCEMQVSCVVINHVSIRYSDMS
jgi:Zn-dependent M16 (insulinase) family peptidase